MKKLWMLVLFVVVGGVMLFVVGCSEDNDDNTGTPEQPYVPSAGVFASVDYSLFLNPDSIFSSSSKLERCPDFDTACFVVGVSGALIQALMFWPRVAFALALTQDPVYEGDLTWRWTLGSDEGNISLYATVLPDIDSVDWDMRITNDELTDFQWFYGRCDFHASGGWWVFNDRDSTDSPYPVLRTLWTKNADDSTGSFTMININETDTEGYGDTITFSREGDICTSTLNLHGGDRPGVWDITWSQTEHWGSITYPEGRTACWDTLAQCIDCDSLPTE